MYYMYRARDNALCILLYSSHCTYLGIVEEGEEDLVEENDWTEQEIQQSQQPYPEPQSVEERGERGAVQ